MKHLFTWFWRIDNSLWGGEVESNRYVSSLLLLFAFVCGLFVGLQPLISDSVPYFSDTNIVSVTALMVYVAGILVCESFCVAVDLVVALLRSLLIVLLLFALYGGGIFIGRILS